MVKEETVRTSPNKTTEEAGLAFNVNGFKNSNCGIKNHFVTQNYKVVSKKKDEDGKVVKTEDTPKFRKAHVVMSAAMQQLCQLLVSEGLKHMPEKDKSGMKRMNRLILRNAVLLNKEFDRYYHSKVMEEFNKEMPYSNLLPV